MDDQIQRRIELYKVMEKLVSRWLEMLGDGYHPQSPLCVILRPSGVCMAMFWDDLVRAGILTPDASSRLRAMQGPFYLTESEEMMHPGGSDAH